MVERARLWSGFGCLAATLALAVGVSIGREQGRSAVVREFDRAVLAGELVVTDGDGATVQRWGEE